MWMISGFVGYLNYIVILFLATGAFMFVMDIKSYKADHYKKEKKAAKISAWINLSLGVVMFLGSWIYKRYLW